MKWIGRIASHCRTSVLWPISLVVTIALVWCYAYDRWDVRAWRTPIAYSGDAWGEMGTAKAFAVDAVAPILQKYPRSLGAPFTANWNDHLTAEEGVFAWYSLFVRTCGLFLGSNLAVLAAHLLAGLSLYFACRTLEFDCCVSFSAGVLFAMSHFAFARSLPHLVLTYYWHVPLGLLVVWWCLDAERRVLGLKRLLFSVFVAVIHGIQFPYYTGIFLQFLGLSAIVQLLRRAPWRKVLAPVLLISATLAAFLLINLDTICFRLMNGRNEQVVVRSYAGLELYALKPLELLIPASHRIAAWQTWSNRTYFSQALFIGEGGSPYLGIISIIGLGLMVWRALRGIANNNLAAVPVQFWGVLWIILYSAVGGINGFIGLFGMVLFRGTNRYSIVIMALALLFLARETSRLFSERRRLFVVVIVLICTVIGLWDQVPPAMTKADVRGMRKIVESDRALVEKMEAHLPPRGMVFELPVMDYPETAPIQRMTDYEPLRPYLHSHFLRFSYGSDKGRPRERWQKETEQLQPGDVVRTLERYGFSAVLINRKGYSDSAVGLINGLNASGRQTVVADNADFVCISLQPDKKPVLPPEFDDQWFGFEGSHDRNWRWSHGNATITLHNTAPAPENVHVTFRLGTIEPRRVQVFTATGLLDSVSIQPESPTDVQEIKLVLRPGPNILSFQTDQPPSSPQNGDARKLAFDVIDFKLER